MITTHCQRWRDRRGSYRIASEPIHPQHYEVALLGVDREAKAFVEQHHYSASYCAALLRVGLSHRGELVGVAVLSQSPSQAALDAALPLVNARRAELGRFVLLDAVPANGESWFLARVFELARQEGFEAVVAYSDPEPRYALDGRCVLRGHVGTIYQASNARYTGRTRPSTWRLFDDGTVFSPRAWSKLRKRERGWRYAVEQLVAHGAPQPPSGPSPCASWKQWVSRAVGATTRTRRHPGNHRYVWALEQRLWRMLPEERAYPKLDLGKTLELPWGQPCTSSSP